MRIREEEWSKLTCRQLFELILKYNSEAKNGEDVFYFISGGLFNGRLTKGAGGNPGITFAITRETFDSDELVENAIREHQLLRVALIAPSDYE